MAASCVEPLSSAVEQAEGEGTLTLNLCCDPATKANSDATALTKEKDISVIHIILFQKSGSSYVYYRREQLEPDANGSWSGTLTKVHLGTYKVIALANKEAITGTTESAIEANTVSLSSDWLGSMNNGPMGRFPMYGKTASDVEVTATSGSANITLTRLASRVFLKKVKNSVPSGYANSGAITLKGMFLENVYTTATFGASGASSGWANLGGRLSGQHASTSISNFIDAQADVYPSDANSLLWKTYSESVANGQTKTNTVAAANVLYCMPNPKTTDDSFTGDILGPVSSTSSVPCARLVVLATVNGEDWWYPVTLKGGMARNATYDVEIEIKGTGSKDPNEPVSKGSLTATVTVAGWASTEPYTEVI